MKNGKKLLALLLSLCLLLTLLPFSALATEMPDAETEIQLPDAEVIEPETDATEPVETEAQIPVDEPQLPEKITVADIPVRINPLYEGMIDPDTISQPERVQRIPGEVYFPSATFTTEQKAGEQVRNYLKSRTETFTVYVKSESSDYDQIAENLLNIAFAHTGKPTEGDYLMWHWESYGGEVTRSYNNGYYDHELTFYFTYYTTAAQEKEVDTAVSNLLRTLNVTYKSDYQKVCAVYDYICDNVTYDYEHLEDTSYTRMFTAYAALIDKTAVCQGYALLFYRLMLELGVDTRLIAGEGMGVAHAWNIVKLGNVYYNVDSTWDAGMDEYSFFLRNTLNFPGHARYLDYMSTEFHTEYPMSETDYVDGVAGVPEAYFVYGILGEESYWKLGRKGDLVIFGEGHTPDYSASNNPDYSAPWIYWRESITSVTVESGITKLGKYTFHNMSALTSASIAGSVRTINNIAFQTCPALTTITLNEGLQEIGDLAFAGTALTKVDLPNSVVTLGTNVFSGCSQLASVTLPDQLKTIPGACFYECKALTSISIPESVTEIHWSAFNRTGLTEITLPQGLKVLGERAFEECTSLKKVILPDGVTFIPAYAFSGCTSLESLPLHEGITRIDQNAFARCTSLKSIVFPAGLTEIGSFAFFQCTNLNTVDFPEGLKTIGDYSFSNCSALTKIILPDSLTELGNNAFSGASSATELKISSNLTEIPSSAFAYCQRLTKIEIPNGVTTIDINAFQSCTGITELTIPESVTNLSGFEGCSNLETVILNNSGVIDSYAFSGCKSLRNVQFNGEITKIQGSSFQNCDSLVEITIPASVQLVEGISGCDNLEVIYYYGSGRIGHYGLASNPKLRKIVFYGNPTELGSCAFDRCTVLEEIEIPASVTMIDTLCFQGCTGLQTIKFMGDAPNIWNNAFTGVTATAYYPVDNETWAEFVLGNYGGKITWVPYGHEHQWIEEETVAPTCTEQGYTSRLCTVCGERMKDNFAEALGHDIVKHEGKAPSGVHGGWEEYETCTRCDYTTYVELPPEYDVLFIGASLSLKGDIGLNFYAELSDAIRTDTGAYMKFTGSGAARYLAMADGVLDESDGSYRYSVALNAKNMGDDVTAQVYNATGAVGDSKTLSIKYYADYVIGNSTKEEFVNLMKAMLNYGAAAQVEFGYDVEHLVNADMTEADRTLPESLDVSGYVHTWSGEEEGIEVTSASLLLQSETKIRIYFKLAEGKSLEDFTFTIDDVEVIPVQSGDEYYIEKTNVAAKDLDTMYTFCLGDRQLVYCGLSYVNQVLTYSSDADLLHLAKALYAYNQAANAYFQSDEA